MASKRMKVGNLKGALLEYIVRQLLKECGFTNVAPDGLFSFEARGLFFINGKGAAHDADVYMNPPIQMPFSYPTQLIFECKAYGTKVGLAEIRNALGLRNDVNDFEVITEDSLRMRQNNRRSEYAIEARKRYLYQVGVAGVNQFSKPAIEFASNNKIPLLSLSWFLSPQALTNFNSLDQELIDSIDPDIMKSLYDFLKDRNGDIYAPTYRLANSFLAEENIIGDIVTFANVVIQHSFVGLLETGDMVFLFARSSSGDNILNKLSGIGSLKAEIHYFPNRPNVWRLTVSDQNQEYESTDFDFFVPQRIFDYWKKFNLDQVSALQIKGQFFSKIFVFNQRNNPEAPFSIINIDRDWLMRVSEIQSHE
jgi:hypothetical protein